MLDLNGLVIGVVTAKVNTPKVFQKTGRVMRNIGIAISRPTVLDFLFQHLAFFVRIEHVAQFWNMLDIGPIRAKPRQLR